MKKILALVVAAGAAILVLLKLKARPAADPWHEATTR
ncbi:DLW-39 family protein [Pseudonocardia pini]|nr:DLW-39 family protein [Pseudonocardia pini]